MIILVRDRTNRGEDMYKDPIGYRIKQLNHLVKRHFEKKFGKPDEATMMQRWVISFVHTRAEKGIDTFSKDIENELCINRSTTSEMLKLMCQKNMIERVSVPQDARLKKIVLTEKYENYINLLSEEMENVHNILVNGLSDEEIEMYIKLTDKLIDNMNKERMSL